ncbi:MAG: hypothetical protein K0R46_2822 [Herbinix sp.]|jgi:hypothetical protein|nr:hypothetical protein [Herbinix sp.]
MNDSESGKYINYDVNVTSNRSNINVETSTKSDSLINIIKNNTIIYGNIVEICPILAL